MKTRWSYTWTNAFGEKFEDDEIFDAPREDFDFGTWLDVNNVRYDFEEDAFWGTYYVLDENGERTGESYEITSIDDMPWFAVKSDSHTDFRRGSYDYDKAYTMACKAAENGETGVQLAHFDERNSSILEVEFF